MIHHFKIPQNFLKMITRNPFGLGAVSLFISLIANSTSCNVNGLINSSLCPSNSFPLLYHILSAILIVPLSSLPNNFL
jgi:hypothetical protein